MLVREATAGELDDWDDLTVRSPNGSVQQSRAWAAYRSDFGWRPRFLVTDDGGRVLALARPWPLIRSDGVYISRGPLPETDPHLTLARLDAVTAWLTERGVSVVSSDAEVPAATGYPSLLEAAGFHPIEEIQPSRHKLVVDLTGIRDPADLLTGFSATTRNMIRAAQRSDLAIVRLGFGLPAPSVDAVDGGTGSTEVLLTELDALYVHMRANADRRGFGLASKARFTDWTRRALEAGQLAYIGAHEPGGELVAGATFYRHGRRWTYSNAADDPRFPEGLSGRRAARRLGRAQARRRGGSDRVRPRRGRCPRSTPPTDARRAGLRHVDLQGIVRRPMGRAHRGA